MITHYETEAAQKKLNNITENRGTNSKQFWNLVRIIKNNIEDMYAVTTEDDQQFFSEHDIKEQTTIFYQKLYTPRMLYLHITIHRQIY